MKTTSKETINARNRRFDEFMQERLKIFNAMCNKEISFDEAKQASKRVDKEYAKFLNQIKEEDGIDLRKKK